MLRQYIYFNELPDGCLFTFNGNHYKKQSTRTAFMDEAGIWFYMGMRDLCVIATGHAGTYCRLAADYFDKER